MLRIIRSTEVITVDNICLQVYGSPGIGKTSLSFTASNPLLLDFDRGSHRSFCRGDTVQINKWEEVKGMTEQDLSGYDTVIVDTVGRLLDVLTVSITSGNPKMKGYGGALSLQGYGVLKVGYAGWLKTLRSYGKDVVLIAHDKEDKKGDEVIYRPDIQGGSYSEVFKSADSIAYMHKVGRDTVLDFSPTDQWIGKNAAGFDPLVVPNFSTNHHYLGDIISGIKDKLNEMSKDQVEALAVVSIWKDKIAQMSTEEDVNGAIPQLKELKNPMSSQVKAILSLRAKELGLVGDRDAGKYVKPATEGKTDG